MHQKIKFLNKLKQGVERSMDETFKTLVKEMFKIDKRSIFHIYWLEDLILLIHPFYPQLSTYSLQSLSKFQNFSQNKQKKFYNLYKTVVVVQLPGHVWLWLHRLHCARLPCPLPSPRICPSPCPLNWWCHSTNSHPLSASFSSAFNLSQHQGLFQWVSYSH